ncbi:ribonuclease P protein component [uncultured Roseovarius sp.]|uniref:ribonuclease P protein component n=1 Tax=uncultured Roseovarius sp. TaxID=293344 RepID=UPI002619A5F3|nr:ribonuclease P protein component [uncultured Roseovarius sp.]
MIPPEAPENIPGNTPPAVSVCLEVLKNRSDFLAAARARRQATQSMVVQARNRHDEEAHVGVGFTCSKKVGNAVARNRAKRRLREAARTILSENGQPGWDYVLIGRAEITATRPFDLLQQDLRDALHRLHAKP